MANDKFHKYIPIVNRFSYDDLDLHFTAPKRVGVDAFYPTNIKIPRKLKKKVKQFCGVYWVGLTNAQRLWYYMETTNNEYKRFIIKQICRIGDNDISYKRDFINI
jgi:hypothetical protein